MKSFCKFSALLFLFLTFSAILSADVKHTVQKGETYYSISKKYDVTVAQLLKANDQDDSAVLKVGQVLTVPQEDPETKDPDTQRYTIEPGDTLYSISRRFNTTVAGIQELNNLGNNTDLKSGQTILVPADSVSQGSKDSSAGISGTEAVISAGVQTAESSAAKSEDSILSVTSVTPLQTQQDPRNYTTRKGDTSLVWPVKAAEITYVSGKISGVSIITLQKNENVNVIQAGTVLTCSTYRGFGYVVFIQATTGHIYVYSGLDSVSVKPGQVLSYGDKLGIAGVDALSGKSQISLMVYKNGKVIDPAVAPRGN